MTAQVDYMYVVQSEGMMGQGRVFGLYTERDNAFDELMTYLSKHTGVQDYFWTQEDDEFYQDGHDLLIHAAFEPFNDTFGESVEIEYRIFPLPINQSIMFGQRTEIEPEPEPESDS